MESEYIDAVGLSLRKDVTINADTIRWRARQLEIKGMKVGRSRHYTADEVDRILNYCQDKIREANLLTVRQISDLTGLGESAVRERVQRLKLRAKRGAGRRLYFTYRQFVRIRDYEPCNNIDDCPRKCHWARNCIAFFGARGGVIALCRDCADMIEPAQARIIDLDQIGVTTDTEIIPFTPRVA